MYFKTGDNGGSVKLSSKFVRSTVLSGCHWQHSCCTLNAELSCNWEEKSNISRKRYLSGMEQPEPKHSQKKSNHSRPKKYWVAQNTKFWGIMWDFISSKFCLKIQARRPGRGIMDSGSTVMLGLLCQFDSVYRTRVRSLAMLVTHSLTNSLPNSRLVNFGNTETLDACEWCLSLTPWLVNWSVDKLRKHGNTWCLRMMLDSLYQL